MNHDPRPLIARLAVAVMTADGRIGPAEQAALARLDHLGLGLLSPLACDEIGRAIEGPLNVDGACAALAELGPEAAAVIVSALADVAVSDRDLAAQEIKTLRYIGERLGLGPGAVEEIVGANMGGAIASSTAQQNGASPATTGSEGPLVGRDARGSAPPTCDMRRAHAYRVLGVAPGADAVSLDAAYLKLIARYNPDKLTDLGADFAVLAVHRLSEATAAYQLLSAEQPDQLSARASAAVGEL